MSGQVANDDATDDLLDQQATGDGWWGRWRAVQAWELTIEMPLVVAGTMFSVAMGHQFVVKALVDLTPIITFYLTGRFAVLGVHVWKGSQERQHAMSERSVVKSSRAD